MLNICKMYLNNSQLVNGLKVEGVLRTPSIIKAFLSVDRVDFVNDDYLDAPYVDQPLSIGFEQTISQPYTVAFMLELLSPQEGELILDVGSGSGWTTALLAQIVGESGRVYGLELVPELVRFGQENLNKYDFSQANIRQASSKLGLPEEAPFDRILVSAGDSEVPSGLLQQLKIGGVLVMPVRDAIWKIVRTSETKTKIEKFEGFVFVPLVH